MPVSCDRQENKFCINSEFINLNNILIGFPPAVELTTFVQYLLSCYQTLLNKSWMLVEADEKIFCLSCRQIVYLTLYSL